MSIPDHRTPRRLEVAAIAKYQALQKRLRNAFSGNVLPGARPSSTGR